MASVIDAIPASQSSATHRPPQDRIEVRSTNAIDVDALVRPGWVHSSIYVNEQVFDREIERIFHRGWVYIGHENEILKSGEFRLRKMGRQPVIMVRGNDGVVRVLMNRCRHRGAVVCEVEAGREKFFRCWYHGWTYDNTGKLVSVSGPEGYGDSFNPDEHSLSPAPRFDSYKGFVFAALSTDVPELADYLGPAAPMIDLMIDAVPNGEIRLGAGHNKTRFRANWKQVGMDGYHPHYVHASVLATWERKADSGVGATHGANPFAFDSIAETRDFGNGHSMLDLRSHRVKHFEKYSGILDQIAGGAEYKKAIFARHGEDYGRVVLATAGDPHVGIFPNLQMINNQIRIINPVSVSETEVIMFPVLFDGVSDELNTFRLRQHESFYGPAGSGSPDDAEIFERTQLGLQAQVDPWIDISRGIERERDEDGVIVGHISDEVPQRGQMRQWLQMMRDQ